MNRAKQQLKASMAFQNDGTSAVCDEIGRQIVTNGSRLHPLELNTLIEVRPLPCGSCTARFCCVLRVLNITVW